MTERRAVQPSDRLAAASPTGAPPLRIVLVEPQIPPNTGNVARLCAATGCALHLVEPLGFSIDDRELKRAGLDYWASVDLHVHPTFAEFAAAWDVPYWFLSTRGGTPYARAPFGRGDALVFGKETAGLPDAMLRVDPARVLRIPMRAEGVRSLNLSTSVGIVAYAALAALGFPEMQ